VKYKVIAKWIRVSRNSCWGVRWLRRGSTTHKAELADLSKKMLKDAVMVGWDSRTAIRAVCPVQMFENPSWRLLLSKFEFPFWFCCVCCVDNIFLLFPSLGHSMTSRHLHCAKIRTRQMAPNENIRKLMKWKQ